MELRHLRYFVAVAEEQNITRAAARLHVSQPPLSRQIKDLELELGVSLLERSAKSVRLTDAGRIFVEEAKAVLQRATDAVQAVRTVAHKAQSELHVGYAPSLTVEVLPHALRLFQEKSPEVRVVLHDLSTEEMLVGLTDRKLSLVLMIQPAPKARKGLIFTELRRYTVCVAMHSAHPLARASQVTLNQVTADRLLAYSRAEYPEYYEWLEHLCKPLRLQPQVVEEHDGATSLIASVEAGRGIAFVPESFSCLVGNRLTLRPLTPAVPPFVLGAVRPRGAVAPHAARFIAAAQEAVRKPLVKA